MCSHFKDVPGVSGIIIDIREAFVCENLLSGASRKKNQNEFRRSGWMVYMGFGSGFDVYVSVHGLLYKVVTNVHMSMRSLLYNGS